MPSTLQLGWAPQDSGKPKQPGRVHALPARPCLPRAPPSPISAPESQEPCLAHPPVLTSGRAWNTACTPATLADWPQRLSECLWDTAPGAEAGLWHTGPPGRRMGTQTKSSLTSKSSLLSPIQEPTALTLGPRSEPPASSRQPSTQLKMPAGRGRTRPFHSPARRAPSCGQPGPT